MDAAALEQTTPGTLRSNLFANAPDPGNLFGPASVTSGSIGLPGDVLNTYQRTRICSKPNGTG